VSVEAESARELGRYAVLDEIAAGGMATVHLGRPLEGDGSLEFVAIKRMHAQFSRDPDFRSMFLDEAKLVRRIQHENVVRTLDVVDGEELLLVMELIDGESLSRLAKQTHQRGERIPRPIVSAVLQDLLRGLHAAHEATNEAGEPLAIVHRDVSPHNVIVGTDGVSRVLDFGVAKARGRMQQTQQGQIKGKLAYMSPEQARGKPVDRRSDLFASGIVLWELLVGGRLFDGENEASVLTQLLVDKPAAPSTKLAELAPFDALVLKALETNADARFATALEFAEQLGQTIPAAPRSEVQAWVKAEAHVAIERRNAIRAARSRENRVSGAAPARIDSSADVREGTPSGISRSAMHAAKSGVSVVSLPDGPRPSTGLRFGGARSGAPRPEAAIAKEPTSTPKPPILAVPPPAQSPRPVATLPRPNPPPAPKQEVPRVELERLPEAPFDPLTEPTPVLDDVPTGAHVAPDPSAMTAPQPQQVPAPTHTQPVQSFQGSVSGGWVATNELSHIPSYLTGPFQVPAANPPASSPGTTARMQRIETVPAWTPPPPSYGARPPPAAPTPVGYAPAPMLSVEPAKSASSMPPPLAPEQKKRLLWIAIATAVLVSLALASILIIIGSGDSKSKATPSLTSSAGPATPVATSPPTPASASRSAPHRAIETQPAAASSAAAAADSVAPSESASAMPSTGSDVRFGPAPGASAKKKKTDYGF
jgi:serine/threonine protein kinase